MTKKYCHAVYSAEIPKHLPDLPDGKAGQAGGKQACLSADRSSEWPYVTNLLLIPAGGNGACLDLELVYLRADFCNGIVNLA